MLKRFVVQDRPVAPDRKHARGAHGQRQKHGGRAQVAGGPVHQEGLPRPEPTPQEPAVGYDQRRQRAGFVQDFSGQRRDARRRIDRFLRKGAVFPPGHDRFRAVIQANVGH